MIFFYDEDAPDVPAASVELIEARACAGLWSPFAPVFSDVALFIEND